jgi:hypothetical protein
MPERIQLRRSKGWRKPEGAVVVARPSKWGNPYRVQPVDRAGFYPFGWRVQPEPSVAAHRHVYGHERDARERAVALFRRDAERPSWTERIAELRGKDLACWCPLDQPCHADVLLAIANGAEQ